MGNKSRQERIRKNLYRPPLRKAAGAERLSPQQLAGGLGPVRDTPCGLRIPAALLDHKKPLFSLVGTDVRTYAADALEELASSPAVMEAAVARLASAFYGTLDPELGDSEAERNALVATGSASGALVIYNPITEEHEVYDPPAATPAPKKKKGKKHCVIDVQPTKVEVVEPPAPEPMDPVKLAAEVALCTRPGYKFPAADKPTLSRQRKLNLAVGGATFKAFGVRMSGRDEKYCASRREEMAAKAQRKLDRFAFIEAVKEAGRRLGGIDVTLLTLNADDYIQGGEAKMWANLGPALHNNRHGAFRAGPSWTLMEFVFGRKRMDGKPPMFLERQVVG